DPPWSPRATGVPPPRGQGTTRNGRGWPPRGDARESRARKRLVPPREVLDWPQAAPREERVAEDGARRAPPRIAKRVWPTHRRPSLRSAGSLDSRDRDARRKRDSRGPGQGRFVSKSRRPRRGVLE